MKQTLLTSLLLATLAGSCAAQHSAHAKLTKPHLTTRTKTPVAVDRPESAAPYADGSFPDVPKDHWAAKAVETLHRRGIVVGYPPNKPKLP